MEINKLGYKIVEKNGLLGLVDINNETVLPIKYTYISDTISVNGILMVRDKEDNKILIEIGQ